MYTVQLSIAKLQSYAGNEYNLFRFLFGERVVPLMKSFRNLEGY